MSNQLTYSIGLQVCRPNKLSHILQSLKTMMFQETFKIPLHIVVDRRSTEIENILDKYEVECSFTNGIGNWTSKNVLLELFMRDNTDYVLLFEDDVHFHNFRCLYVMKSAYNVCRQFIGFYKLNSEDCLKTFARDFQGKIVINNIDFYTFSTINTSALLLIDRKAIKTIGFFFNSYYENGFYDYRDRMKRSGLVGDLLMPCDIERCFSVDDSIPSTISREDREIYKKQMLPPAEDNWRPYCVEPAFVLKK